MSVDLADRLEAILRRSGPLMDVLHRLRDIDLPDWQVFSGAVYQRVFNDLTGRDLDHGIKDYDVAYFDPDTSYEAEDAVIRRVAARFEPPLREMVEVRNQARVHLWFEGKFGEPYAPLNSSAEALMRFVSPLHAVAVRLEADDRLTVIAPFGLEDLFALRLRRNPTRASANFERVAQGARSRWPELEIAG
jgi:uncharacterized protein